TPVVGLKCFLIYYDFISVTSGKIPIFGSTHIHGFLVPQPLQNSTADEMKAGNQEFKASLSYMANLSTTWNIGDPVKTRKMRSKTRRRTKSSKEE
ncbi:hypothetical protein STEG23_025472, partial [Scotinomys teguina]